MFFVVYYVVLGVELLVVEVDFIILFELEKLFGELCYEFDNWLDMVWILFSVLVEGVVGSGR